MVMQLLPELAAVGCILVIFTLSLFESVTGAMARRAAIFGSLVMLAAALAASHESVMLFANGYRVDAYSQFFKVLIAVGLALNAMLGWPLRSIPSSQRTEYYLFFFSAGLGMMFLSSVYNFLVLYLSMELVSYSIYVMIGMRRDRTESVESTVKYFLIGAASSAIGLYGLTLIYGSINGLGFEQLVTALQQSPGTASMIVPGLVMVFSSFLFKLAAFPFHVWAPDAYDASASPVAMFLASVSKLAGIAALFRIVFMTHNYLPQMENALGVIAVLTMSYGNFVAFRQTRVKRLVAYSSIAQAGYILLGMIGFAESSTQAVLYYAVVYLLMNVVLFMVTLELETTAPDPELSGFHGLHRRNALMALALMVSLFSLAGVPPLSGFFGKWLLFSSAAANGHIWFVVIAILNSVISLYYYLLLVKSAYYANPNEIQTPLVSNFMPRVAAYVLSAAIVLLGIFPRPLMDYLASLNLPVTMLP